MNGADTPAAMSLQEFELIKKQLSAGHRISMEMAGALIREVERLRKPATDPSSLQQRIVNLPLDHQKQCECLEGIDNHGQIYELGHRDARHAAAELASAAEVELADMEARKDAAYLERNQCVAGLAALAMALGCRAGIAKTAIEGWSEDWHGCVYIDLPTGQVSWHYHDSQAGLFDFLPAYNGKYDGHDTPEKYRRVFSLRYCFSTALADAHTPAATVAALAAGGGEGTTKGEAHE